MTDARQFPVFGEYDNHWTDKKTWQLTYSMIAGADMIHDMFFTQAEARRAASFITAVEKRDIILLIDLVGREIHTLKHPLEAEVIDFPEQEPQF